MRAFPLPVGEGLEMRAFPLPVGEGLGMRAFPLPVGEGFGVRGAAELGVRASRAAKRRAASANLESGAVSVRLSQMPSPTIRASTTTRVPTRMVWIGSVTGVAAVPSC